MDDHSMESLKQENHDLKQKLQLARQMELAYLEEIEQLKETLHATESAQLHVQTDKPALNSTYTSEWEERARVAEEKYEALCEELRQCSAENSRLKECLAATELRLESTEASVSTSDPSQCSGDIVALLEENAKLKQELDNLECGRRMECSRMERQLTELEEDRCVLRDEVTELQRHLKQSREELRDVRAQLEAIEMQSNSTAQTRGNSAFSEVEDRRVRAERLVQQQRQIIERLQTDLKNLNAESKRKLNDEVQKLEIRFRERDTKFTDNLVTERKRLLEENRTLTLQLQQMEELQIEQESRAVELSKAFKFEGGKSQDNLIKSLEKRNTQLQRRLADKSSQLDGLREQVLSANLLRRQMQAELWKQMDLCTRLSEQLDSYRQNKNLHLQSPQFANKDNAPKQIGQTAPSNQKPGERDNVENIEPTDEQEPEVDDDNKTHVAATERTDKAVIDIRTLSNTEVKEGELPPDCKVN